MQLSVLSNSATPIYRQIYEQISAQILRGTLQAGSALPPIRSVAKSIGVSIITVRSAWDALERDGYVHTVAGSGCYVLPRAPSPTAPLGALFDERLHDAARRAKEIGMTEAEFVALSARFYQE